MKTFVILACAACAATLTGCKTNSSQEVVKETYIHKYGVPVAKDDWSRNGKDGQVAQLLSDGVTVTRSYEKGILHGKTTLTFSNSSTIHFVETYNQGNLTSKVENYPSGVPLEEAQYEGGRIAQITRWYEDGAPAASEIYENGLIVQGEYRSPLNVIESRILEGMGTRILRGNDGELLSKDTIQNGQMNERVTYFSNGDPATVTPYENNQIHGMRLTFLVGGLPNTVEHWINGKQEGMTIVYTNGEKAFEIPFTNGEKNGVELRYRDGKTIVEEVSWVNGVQHGPRKILADEASKTEWYHQGELVNRPTFERLNPPHELQIQR